VTLCLGGLSDFYFIFLLVQDLENARMWYYTACPFIPMAILAFHGLMLPKLVGMARVHVVNIGEIMLPQFPGLMRLLKTHSTHTRPDAAPLADAVARAVPVAPSVTVTVTVTVAVAVAVAVAGGCTVTAAGGGEQCVPRAASTVAGGTQAGYTRGSPARGPLRVLEDHRLELLAPGAPGAEGPAHHAQPRARGGVPWARPPTPWAYPSSSTG